MYNHLNVLFSRLGIAMLFFTLSRILIYLFNLDLFPDAGMMVFIKALIFDAATVTMIFSPFILLSALPLPFLFHSGWKLIKKIIFHTSNILSIGLNSFDLKFMAFTQKRTTADVLEMLKYGGSEVGNLLPSIIADYWWVALIAGVQIWLGIRLYRLTEKKDTAYSLNWKWEVPKFILMVFFFIVVARGGFATKPIHIVQASQYTEPQNVPLLLNTPFTMIKTWDYKGLEPKEFMAKEKAEEYFFPIRKMDMGKTMQKKNVVLFILESFSTEYIGAITGKKGSTPFLDSLAQQSLLFTHAYANGKRSIEAMPSIIASIPTLMESPYITSPYSANKIQSLASILGEQGYYTGFFHGANNGSMGFDAFASMSGFQEYHGRNEYNNDADHDGSWGIWDEEFFLYFKDQLTSKKEPFFGALFSLTSHHPYAVPERYQSIFTGASDPMENVVRYTDHSLKHFFEAAQKEYWYSNTLFVITADHTSHSNDPYYVNPLGRYRIPLILFAPGDPQLLGRSDKVVQQIDIMPTVLDYLNYPQEIFAFGNSAFAEEEGICFNYLNNTVQLITKDQLLQISDDEIVGRFVLPADSLLQNNTLNIPVSDPSNEFLLKAIIQTYNHCLLNNTMTPDGYQ